MSKFWHDIKIIIIVVFLMLSSFRSALWIAQELQGFSSPSSEVGVDSSATAFTLLSTMDLQRELNRRGYKLKVDGDCGTATQAAWDAECGNQYAIELMFEEPTP